MGVKVGIWVGVGDNVALNGGADGETVAGNVSVAGADGEAAEDNISASVGLSAFPPHAVKASTVRQITPTIILRAETVFIFKL